MLMITDEDEKRVNEKLIKITACNPSSDRVEKLRDLCSVMFKFPCYTNLRAIEMEADKIIAYYEPDMSPVFMNMG